MVLDRQPRGRTSKVIAMLMRNSVVPLFRYLHCYFPKGQIRRRPARRRNQAAFFIVGPSSWSAGTAYFYPAL